MRHKTILFGAISAQLILAIGGCETKKIENINPDVLRNIQNNSEFTTRIPAYPIQVSDPVPPPELEIVEDPALVEPPLGAPDEVEIDPTTGLPIEPPPVPPIEDDFGGDFYDEFEDDGIFVAGVCGDGKRSITEQCDDGNTDNLDGCNVLCKFPYCGNGVLEKDEWCDDANQVNGDGCNKMCEFERCGNACLDPGEQCDDGNTENGDGCSKACWREECGNSIIDLGEQCDDGNEANGDGCSQFCQLEICGNGVVTPNEQCDDGNCISGDGCSANCRIEVPALN